MRLESNYNRTNKLVSINSLLLSTLYAYSNIYTYIILHVTHIKTHHNQVKYLHRLYVKSHSLTLKRASLFSISQRLHLHEVQELKHQQDDIDLQIRSRSITLRVVHNISVTTIT